MDQIKLLKKFRFIIFAIILLLTKNVYANFNFTLKDYLDKNDLEDGSTQIYLLKRCSAVYAYASGVILKSDAVTSKSFIEISNNLLFKAVELKVIDEKKKLEDAQEEAEKSRKELFNIYITDGKKNWEKNKSHFKGSYISDDMVICSKLTEDN